MKNNRTIANKNKKPTAQQIQDRIFRKMSTEKKIKVIEQLYLLGRELQRAKSK